MARVNVFLGEDLLRAIDAEAAAAKTNRSALIQSALKTFLDSVRQAREDARARREMAEAVRGIDALADKLGDWDGVKIVRQFRDSRSLPVNEPAPRYKPKRRKARS